MSSLRDLANRAFRALAELPDPARRKRAADDAIGWWLSGAQEDQQVSNVFKCDIIEWFDAIAQLDNATKLATLLARAQILLRAPVEPMPAPVEPIIEPDFEDMPGMMDYEEGDIVTIGRGKIQKRFLIIRGGPLQIDLDRHKPSRPRAKRKKSKRV